MAHTKPQMIRLLLLATFAALSLLPTAATADSRHGMTERFHRIETMIALGLVPEASAGNSCAGNSCQEKTEPFPYLPAGQRIFLPPAGRFTCRGMVSKGDRPLSTYLFFY